MLNTVLAWLEDQISEQLSQGCPLVFVGASCTQKGDVVQ